MEVRTRACTARRLMGCGRPMRRMGAGARAPPGLRLRWQTMAKGQIKSTVADAPLTFSGLATFWKRWAHCIAVRLSKFSAI